MIFSNTAKSNLAVSSLLTLVKMSKKLRVAIITNPWQAYGRNIIRGSVRFLEESYSSVRADIITIGTQFSGRLLEPYDGFLESSPVPELSVLAGDRPVIWVDDPLRANEDHCLMLDNYQIGKTAAECLFHYGARSFVYYDAIRNENKMTQMRSDIRLTGFCERLIELGVKNIRPDHVRHERSSPYSSRNWIHTLAKPLGVFAFNDLGSLEIIDACRLLNISVPREVAVIGVDDDKLLCSLSCPPLSSIEPGTQKIAYEAMKLLTQRLQEPSQFIHKPECPPPVPVERESTGKSSISDDVIRKALSHINSEISSGRNLFPSGVAKLTGVSLRALESLFKETLGKTIQQAILDKQLETIKYLLRTTQSTIEQISEQLEMQLPSLRRSFLRIEGMTPGQYRRRFLDNQTTEKIPAFIDNPNTTEICFMNRFDGIAGFDYLRGAQHYVQLHPDIRLTIISEIPDQPQMWVSPKTISAGKCHGYIISPALDPPAGVKEKVPVIYIEHQREHRKAWSLAADNYQIGVLAAQHLMMKGHTNYIYYSYHPDITSSVAEDTRDAERYRGFHETLLAAGIEKGAEFSPPRLNETDTIAWLNQLPKPVAVFAFNDAYALELIHLCNQAQVNIPDELALIGVDDDELLCKLAHPSLSSVRINFQHIGYRALEMLSAAIHKNPYETPEMVSCPPSYVTERESTRPIVTRETSLRRAVEFISCHFREPLKVNDVVNASKVSRRTLEYHFRSHLNKSISEYLQLFRLTHSAYLLSSGFLPVSQIADQSGYLHTRHFCHAFKQQYGTSPLQFRNQRLVP